MALGYNVRKFLYQNQSSGKKYEVIFTEATNGAVSGVGRLLGTNMIGSEPQFDNTEVAFVVLTTQVGKVFGTGKVTDSQLHTGAYYDASNPAAAGALLSTLLV